MKKDWHGGTTKKRKRAKKDYHTKRYGNPLFRHTKKKKMSVSTVRRRVVVVLIAALLTGGIGYLIWSPVFRITAVEIRGATPMTEQRVRDILAVRLESRTMLIFPQSSIFFFDKRMAQEDISGEFFFESLSITKQLPGRVMVELVEIPKSVILFADNKFNAVSKGGTVIRELTEAELQRIGDLPEDIEAVLVPELGAEMVELAVLQPENESSGENAPSSRHRNEFPLVFDDDHAEDPYSDTYRPGDSSFAPTTVALILESNARLPDITGRDVRWYHVREKDEAVDVTMEGDWHVYLTTTLPFDVQGERLMLVLKEKIGQERGRLQYIDLRYNERIFYKFRSDEGGDEDGDEGQNDG